MFQKFLHLQSMQGIIKLVKTNFIYCPQINFFRDDVHILNKCNIVSPKHIRKTCCKHFTNVIDIQYRTLDNQIQETFIELCQIYSILE